MITRLFEKVPAGNMMIPLLITAILASFFPDILHFGKFTQAIFTSKGMLTIMGINLICTGAQLKINNLLKVIKKAGVIILAKNLTAILIIVVVSNVFGKEGFLGISLLALVCASLNHNNSVYISLNYDFGDDLDLASSALTSLVTGPLLAMLVLGAGGLADIPLNSVIDAFIPISIGFIIGNLDENVSAQLKKGQKIIIPFLGFSMGYNINFFDIFKSGISGFILAFIIIFIIGPVTTFFDRKINKTDGHAGAAIATTGANAIAVPSIIASIDPNMLRYVDIATVQVATSVIVTIFITPLLTGLLVKYKGDTKA